MTNRPATTAEVRALYNHRGDIARISRDGRITYKRDSQGPWLEGRWVSEYRVDQNGTIYLA